MLGIVGPVFHRVWRAPLWQPPFASVGKVQRSAETRLPLRLGIVAERLDAQVAANDDGAERQPEPRGARTKRTDIDLALGGAGVDLIEHDVGVDAFHGRKAAGSQVLLTAVLPPRLGRDAGGRRPRSPA